MWRVITAGLIVAVMVALPLDLPALANPLYAASCGIVAMVLVAWAADRAGGTR